MLENDVLNEMTHIGFLEQGPHCPKLVKKQLFVAFSHVTQLRE